MNYSVSMNIGSQAALLEKCRYVYTPLRYFQTYFKGSHKLENFAVYRTCLTFIKLKKYWANIFFLLTKQIGLPSLGLQNFLLSLVCYKISMSENSKAKKQLAMTDYFCKVNCKTI